MVIFKCIDFRYYAAGILYLLECLRVVKFIAKFVFRRAQQTQLQKPNVITNVDNPAPIKPIAAAVTVAEPKGTSNDDIEMQKRLRARQERFNKLVVSSASKRIILKHTTTSTGDVPEAAKIPRLENVKSAELPHLENVKSGESFSSVAEQTSGQVRTGNVRLVKKVVAPPKPVHTVQRVSLANNVPTVSQTLTSENLPTKNSPSLLKKLTTVGERKMTRTVLKLPVERVEETKVLQRATGFKVVDQAVSPPPPHLQTDVGVSVNRNAAFELRQGLVDEEAELDNVAKKSAVAERLTNLVETASNITEVFFY